MTKETRQSHPYLIPDITIILLVLALLAAFQTDGIFIAMYGMITAYVLATGRARLLFPLATALLLSGIWAYLAQDYYAYERDFRVFQGINLWSWSAWTWGLFLVCYVFRRAQAWLGIQRQALQLLVFSLIFWSMLLSVETLAYHVFDLVDIATSKYEGLPLCDCIHAPRWMQASYLAMGPVYFILTRSLRWLVSRRGWSQAFQHQRLSQAVSLIFSHDLSRGPGR